MTTGRIALWSLLPALALAPVAAGCGGGGGAGKGGATGSLPLR
jgi:hypothetical protein